MRQLVRQERTWLNCVVQGEDAEMNCFPIHALPGMFLNVGGLSLCLLASRAEGDDLQQLCQLPAGEGLHLNAVSEPVSSCVPTFPFILPPLFPQSSASFHSKGKLVHELF